MANLRYLLRLIFAYLNRFKNIIFLSAILGISVFFIINLILPRLSIKTEKIGVAGRYHTDNLPEFILPLISQGLTSINESQVVVSSLSHSWESPDKGKTWIFYLNENVFWQDGKKVEAQDIVYEFSDVEIECPDNKTIVFKLQDSFIPFPSVVSKPTFRKGLLGTGDWQVKKITVAASFVQELTLVNQKKERKIFKFYPTSDRTKLAYKLGEVDQVMNLLDPNPLDSWKTVEVFENVDKNQIVTLFFNTKDKLLSNKNLRQALTYAIDKKSLGERAISPIQPTSWAYNPQVKKYEYNPQKAKSLIDELDNNLIEGKTIKLVSSPTLLSVAEKIAEYWRQIGIEVTIQVSSITPSEFQAFVSIYDIAPDPDQYSIWHSTQVDTNISQYSDARIDKLLEDGRLELEQIKRREIYLDFQRFLLEDVPAAFLYHPNYYNITRK